MEQWYLRGKQSSESETGSLVQNLSRIDSRRVSNKCSPFSKKFIYSKNLKPATGRKTSLFQQELGKVDPRSEKFTCSKGVRETIFEGFGAKHYSSTGDSVQNIGIVNRSGDCGNVGRRGHKKVKYHISG